MAWPTRRSIDHQAALFLAFLDEANSTLMDPKNMTTTDLVGLAREQVASDSLDENILHELQTRYTRPGSTALERAEICELDRSVFIPRFGYTKLAPGINPVPGRRANTVKAPSPTLRPPGVKGRKEKQEATNAQYTDIVRDALQNLLESKHLFQSQHVDTEKLLAPIPKKRRIRRNVPDGVRLLTSIVNENLRRDAKLENTLSQFKFDWPWLFTGTAPSSGAGGGVQLIQLVTIRIPCAHCNGVEQPHHPKLQEKEALSTLYESKEDGQKTVQIFALPFQCQNCLGEPVIFFIRRTGQKLTLLGRSQFEPVSVPSCIPKSVAGYFQNAEIAFKTGHGLAAIFYLRTCIEQHMRKIVQPTGRVSGEELAEQYQKQLPADFPSRFPSLKKVYQDLSSAMHEARQDDGMFLALFSNVEKHFEAVRLLAK